MLFLKKKYASSSQSVGWVEKMNLNNCILTWLSFREEQSMQKLNKTCKSNGFHYPFFEEIHMLSSVIFTIFIPLENNNQQTFNSTLKFLLHVDSDETKSLFSGNMELTSSISNFTDCSSIPQKQIDISNYTWFTLSSVEKHI